MAAKDVRKFCRYMRRITALPLSDPTALYPWLPNRPNTASYIREDMELRQMLSGAEGRMPREVAASITKEAIAFADGRLVAAAMPAMISHRERLLGGRGPADQERSRKRADVLAIISQAHQWISTVLRGGWPPYS